MVWEDGNLGGNPVLVEKFSQHLHDGAVQSADPHPVQRVIRRGDPVVLTVFDHVVGFAAHRELRVADDADSAFRLREPCQEIDLTVQEHLVKIGESAVDILVLPACVFGNLAVVFIGGALPYRARLGARLEGPVFVVADAERGDPFFGIRRVHGRYQEQEYDGKKRRDFMHTNTSLAKHWRLSSSVIIKSSLSFAQWVLVIIGRNLENNVEFSSRIPQYRCAHDGK